MFIINGFLKFVCLKWLRKLVLMSLGAYVIEA